MRIAEESLQGESVQRAMAGEFGAVVEDDDLAQAGGRAFKEADQDLGDRGRGLICANA